MSRSGVVEVNGVRGRACLRVCVCTRVRGGHARERERNLGLTMTLDDVSGTVRDAADAPERRAGNDAAAVRDVLGESEGCALFTMRVLRVVTGRSAQRATGDCDELLFVLSGAGHLFTGEQEHLLEPESGVLLHSGERTSWTTPVRMDLAIVAVSLHAPLPRGLTGRSAHVLSRLADQAAQAATAEREFRIVFDPDNGCASATQFVGYIPVGRGPSALPPLRRGDLRARGTGRDAHERHETPLEAGSVIHLPARKVHTLANSGPGIMRVLGVFRPAGSPAAAFYPDGTPATYVAEAPKTASIAT